MITEEAAGSDSKERVLLYDLWKLMKGEQQEEISLDNVKVLIMAILRMNDHKRIGVSEPEDAEEQESEIGWYNEKGQICLRPEDLPKIQKHYELLYLNRLHYLGKIVE